MTFLRRKYINTLLYNNLVIVKWNKTSDSNITFRSKKSKRYNKIDNSNNNDNNNNSNNNNNQNNNNNKSSTDNKVNGTPPSSSSKETVFIFGDNMAMKLNVFFTYTKTEP